MSIKDKIASAKPTPFFDDDVVDGWSEWIKEHDKKIIKETLNKVWKKAISMHDDYVELEELDNYIDEIISEFK